MQEAHAIVAQDGLELLSLREVARRLGVSHQAPYRHFPSRDHLLAEIVARAFRAFAAHLDARPRHDDPFQDLGAMGMAYLSYAAEHPLDYRLMFGTRLPDPAAHPAMLREARHAFALLQDAIARLPPRVPGGPPRPVDLDAFAVWSTIHGLASLLQSGALVACEVGSASMEALVPYVMRQIGVALEAGSDRCG